MGELSRGKHKGKGTFELCCKSPILSLSISILAHLYLFPYLSDPFSNQPPTRAFLCKWVSCLILIWSLICWQPGSFTLFCTYSESSSLTLLIDSLEGYTVAARGYLGLYGSSQKVFQFKSQESQISESCIYQAEDRPKKEFLNIHCLSE